jgi:hypothetical protein
MRLWTDQIWSNNWSYLSIAFTTTPLILNTIIAPAFLWSLNRPYRGWTIDCKDKQINKSHCKLKNPALPPPYLFSLVRFFLLVMIGFAWGLAHQTWLINENPHMNELNIWIWEIDLGFTILTFLLFTWTIIFSSGNVMKFATFYLFCLFLTSLLWTVYLTIQISSPFDIQNTKKNENENGLSVLLLCPLLAWEIYSMYLNMSNVSFYLKPEKL